MKRNRCVLVLFIVVILSSKAQVSYDFLNILPASPTSAELAKYAEIPVSCYTGIPDITIPLYTVQCGDITMPITLSYHAGGIRVAQVASWVGLGWSLNAGGIVKCSEGSYADLKSIKELYKIEQGQFIGYSLSKLQYLTYEDSYVCIKPFLYTYNFMGYQGTFFENDKIHFADKGKALQINRRISKLGLVDLKGRTYYFDEQETTGGTKHLYTYYRGNLQYRGKVPGKNIMPVTAYLLTKTVSANHVDSIIIKYNEQREFYKDRIAGTIAFYDGSWNNSWESPSYQFDLSLMTKKISEIVTTNGEVITFIAEYPRMDIKCSESGSEVPYALTQIVVKRKDGKRLKKWVFEYDHFTSYVSDPIDPTTQYRLRLKGLKEYGSDDNFPRIYRFKYYGDNSGEPQMPYRTSYDGVDSWGYCNKMVSESSSKEFRNLFPSVNRHFSAIKEIRRVDGDGAVPVNWNDSQSTSSTDYQVSFSGSDKDPNPLYVHAYSLKEIIYPTGGRRCFEYEPNAEKLTLCGGIRIKRIINYFSPTDVTVREYDYLDSGEAYAMPEVIKTRYDEKTTVDKYTDRPGIGIEILSVASTRKSYLEMTSESYAPLYTLNGQHIGYPEVLEKNSEGSIYYNYYSNWDRRRDYPYRSFRLVEDYRGMVVYDREYRDSPPEDRFTQGIWGVGYGRGELAYKFMLDSQDRVIKYEEYDYDFEDTDTVMCMELYSGPASWNAADKHFYDFNTTEYVLGRAVLKGKKIYTYSSTLQGSNDEAILVKEEKYGYNSFNLASRVESTFNDGNSVAIETRYPCDINQGVYKTMLDRRMIDFPMEVVKKVNGNYVSGNLLTYKSYLGYILPEKVYSFHAASPVSGFGYFNGTSIPSCYNQDGQILQHTSHGKVAAMQTKDRINVCYIWGYNHLYPIAEIKNVDYAKLSSFISVSDQENIASRVQPSSEDWARIDRLRNQIPEAHITVLTYDPFVGVTAVISPDKRTLHYNYNASGELQEVYYIESGVKKTVESYDYHYQAN